MCLLDGPVTGLVSWISGDLYFLPLFPWLFLIKGRPCRHSLAACNLYLLFILWATTVQKTCGQLISADNTLIYTLIPNFGHLYSKFTPFKVWDLNLNKTFAVIWGQCCDWGGRACNFKCQCLMSHQRMKLKSPSGLIAPATVLDAPVATFAVEVLLTVVMVVADSEIPVTSSREWHGWPAGFCISFVFSL